MLTRASIRICAPRFSARRVVREYVDRSYPGLRAGTAAWAHEAGGVPTSPDDVAPVVPGGA